MKILPAEEIRRIDQLTTEKYKTPGILLMENAGVRVVEAVESRVEELESQSVVVLCGKGNNGGDGMVVARQLIQRGCIPFVFLLASPDSVSGDARVNLEILTALGHPPKVIGSVEEWESESSGLGRVDVVVDAMLGTGLRKPVEGLLAQVIVSIEERFSDAMVVSIDLPSGCNADRGALAGIAVEADLTVTFSALKHCLVFPPACFQAGEVVVSEIGNPPELIESPRPFADLIGPEDFPEALIPREETSHKGDYGRILIVGGSRGKGGAAAMAARAALQVGGGLVTAAVPAGTLALVAGHTPEVMTEPLSETEVGTLSGVCLESGRFDAILGDKSIVALGPGIGGFAETARVVRDAVRRIKVPLVLDADGINAFVGHLDELRKDREADAPIVITPHPGEMARLTDETTTHVDENRLEVATAFASANNVYVVLKGFRTVVACPDGSAFVNPTGNAGMATAGSGDILTGMISGILGQQHLGSFQERLCLAVYLHGLAGDLAADALGEETLVATDILRYLSQAWADLRGLEVPGARGATLQGSTSGS